MKKDFNKLVAILCVMIMLLGSFTAPVFAEQDILSVSLSQDSQAANVEATIDVDIRMTETLSADTAVGAVLVDSGGTGITDPETGSPIESSNTTGNTTVFSLPLTIPSGLTPGTYNIKVTVGSLINDSAEYTIIDPATITPTRPQVTGMTFSASGTNLIVNIEFDKDIRILDKTSAIAELQASIANLTQVKTISDLSCSDNVLTLTMVNSYLPMGVMNAIGKIDALGGISQITASASEGGMPVELPAGGLYFVIPTGLEVSQTGQSDNGTERASVTVKVDEIPTLKGANYFLLLKNGTAVGSTAISADAPTDYRYSLKLENVMALKTSAEQIKNWIITNFANPSHCFINTAEYRITSEGTDTFKIEALNSEIGDELELRLVAYPDDRYIAPIASVELSQTAQAAGENATVGVTVRMNADVPIGTSIGAELVQAADGSTVASVDKVTSVTDEENPVEILLNLPISSALTAGSYKIKVKVGRYTALSGVYTVTSLGISSVSINPASHLFGGESDKTATVAITLNENATEIMEVSAELVPVAGPPLSPQIKTEDQLNAGEGEIELTLTIPKELVPGSYKVKVIVGPLAHDNTAYTVLSGNIAFVDESFENAIRVYLNKLTGPIPSSDLENIETLDISGLKIRTGTDTSPNTPYDTNAGSEQGKITTLDDIRWFPQLKELVVTGNQITDISALASQTGLTYLNLAINQIEDISALSTLTNLTSLNLPMNQITDISDLSGLRKLKYVNLGNNKITMVPDLSNMTALEQLHLPNNKITKLASMSGLSKLIALNLSNNRVTDISPIYGLEKLTSIYYSNNPTLTVGTDRGGQITGQGEEVTVKVGSANIPVNTSVKAELVTETGEPVDGVAADIGEISDDQAALTLSIPGTVSSGSYRIWVTAGTPGEYEPHSSTVYTVSDTYDESAIVVFADPFLEKAIRLLIHQPNGDVLKNTLPVKLAKYQRIIIDGNWLNADGQINFPFERDTDKSVRGRISSLADLQYFTSSWGLAVNNNKISDLSSLPGTDTLTKLAFLGLNNNEISDLEPLRTKLSTVSGSPMSLSLSVTLGLDNNNITDISPLADIATVNTVENQLISLSLSLNGNQIEDISPLAKRTELTALSLNNNKIKDVFPLAELPYLQTLQLADNEISNISPLAKIPGLTTLDVSKNDIISFLPLQGHAKLTTLTKDGNPTPSATAGIKSVDLSQNIQEKDETVELEIMVKTVNIPNGRSFTAELLKADGKTPLSPAVTVNGTINSNYGGVTQNVPANLTEGIYRVRVNVAGVEEIHDGSKYVIILPVYNTTGKDILPPSELFLSGPQTIPIKAPVDADIYYTIDGSTPKIKNNMPAGTATHKISATDRVDLSLSVTTVVKAIAVANGYTNSAVLQSTFWFSKTGQMPPRIADIDVSTNHEGEKKGDPNDPLDDQYINLRVTFDRPIKTIGTTTEVLNELDIRLNGNIKISAIESGGAAYPVKAELTATGNDYLDFKLHFGFAPYAGYLTVKPASLIEKIEHKDYPEPVIWEDIALYVPNGLKFNIMEQIVGAPGVKASVTTKVIAPPDTTRGMVHMLLLKNGEPVLLGGKLNVYGANIIGHFHDYLTMDAADYASQMPGYFTSFTGDYDMSVDGDMITITQKLSSPGDVLDLRIYAYPQDRVISVSETAKDALKSQIDDAREVTEAEATSPAVYQRLQKEIATLDAIYKGIVKNKNYYLQSEIDAAAAKLATTMAEIDKPQYANTAGILPAPTTFEHKGAITINAPQGATVYYTTDGTEPDISSTRLPAGAIVEPDSGTTKLEGGSSGASVKLEFTQTTLVRAMAVASGYARSEILSATYTVGHALSFTDPAFEKAIRSLLGKSADEDIELVDLNGITELAITGREIMVGDIYQAYDTGSGQGAIRSLADLSYFPDLTSLTVVENQVNNLTPLAALNRLKVLNLRSNRIVELAPLRNMTQLEELYLRQNSITDVSALSGLINLRILDLSYNNIRDFSPLDALTADINKAGQGQTPAGGGITPTVPTPRIIIGGDNTMYNKSMLDRLNDVTANDWQVAQLLDAVVQAGGTEDQTLVTGDGIQIMIPAGALGNMSGDLIFTANIGKVTEPPRKDPSPLVLDPVKYQRQFGIQDRQDGTIHFALPVTISFDIRSFDLPAGTTIDRLAIYRWNEERKDWDRLGGVYNRLLDNISVTTHSFSTYAVMADTKVMPERLAGSNRFETANEVSTQGWRGGAGQVVLVNVQSFPDALAAVPLARKLNAPILLMEGNGLYQSTLAEIERLAPSKIVLIGGTGVISQTVEDAIIEVYGKDNVVRYGGSDRYATAAEIAKALGTKGRAVLANGASFADALAISSYAGYYGIPILFTEADRLPQATAQALSERGVNSTIVVGGKGAISESIFKQLPSAVRYGGEDRYATAIAIADGLKLNVARTYVATGLDFSDALVAGNLAAQTLSPLIMVDKGLPAATENFLAGHKNAIGALIKIGGEGVISSELNKKMKEVISKQ